MLSAGKMGAAGDYAIRLGAVQLSKLFATKLAFWQAGPGQEETSPSSIWLPQAGPTDFT